MVKHYKVYIENFISDFKPEIPHLVDNILVTRECFIQLEYFKCVNRMFLLEIEYSIDNPFLETFKGFFLIAGDGSDFKLPDISRSSPGIQYHKIRKNTPNLAWVNFHHYKM